MRMPDFKLAIFYLQCSEFSNAFYNALYLIIFRHDIKLHHVTSYYIKRCNNSIEFTLRYHNARNIKERKIYSIEELMK